MQCSRCHFPVELRATFCPQCGFLQEANRTPPLDCENHIGEPAIGLCVVCGKPVCGDCASTVTGKFVCEHREHKTLAEHWSVVHVCTFPFEGDMVVQNLINASYAAKLFSFQDHVGLRWVEDTARVQVLVPHEQRDAARKLLNQLQLSESSE